MPVPTSLLLVFAPFWVVINYVRLTRRSRSASASSTIELQPLSLHASTTTFNDVPRLLLKTFRRRPEGGTRVLALYWDLATLVVVFGLVVAQLVLATAACKGVYALLQLYATSQTDPINSLGVVQGLIKRATKQLQPPPSEALLLQPIIPGLTHSYDSLPLVLVALFSSQVFHELGHALAAASESIPLLSIGFRLNLIVPTFYVELPSSTTSHSSVASSTTDLRIAAAGVWHNLLLVGFTWLISSNGLGWGSLFTRVFYESVEGGVLVTEVDLTSPLYELLPPRIKITHLDDLELDSSSTPATLWADYLSSEPSTSTSSSYNSLGWCLATLFTPSDQALPSCCTPASTQTDRLCFQHGASAVSYACLEPSSIFSPPSKKQGPTRCLDDRGCSLTAQKCTSLKSDQRILRIGVEDPLSPDGITKILIYQGPRTAVLHHVSITTDLPRTRLIPLLYLRTIERFYSHLLGLSLALAFFNLLPLPHLDGQVLWSTVWTLMRGSEEVGDRMELGEMGRKEGVTRGKGILDRSIEGMRKVGWLRKLAEREERVERLLRRWTMVMGGLTMGTGVWVVVMGS
ncbi:BZ3500_MvSof-1268-A1-R1_Chr4-2g06993 [Microbotryum saponariae]|uniref:Endopeptidase S2P n=1 Tax=Microbotryum saponariae TaxID=289078 RepID=A0A2X0MWJ3_9BASI|nr:BZ3500_MvSof-1268-A1-R1_Chr4-2g06993 [Microbotryum saponariae]SDA06658.1 BZ3501_MvSof-1269-A2-R1_Chr4-2g06704 [Microbotryum saponariae]